MAQVKAYLDARGRSSEQAAPIKISVTHKGGSALISLGISVRPDEWDAQARKVIKHAQRIAYNSYISKTVSDMEAYILNCQVQGLPLGRNAIALRDQLAKVLSRDEGDDETNDAEPLYYTAYFEEVMARKAKGTATTYLHTLGRIRAFDPRADRLTFEEINKAWLERFGAWLSNQGNSPNTIGIHYRNMRTVFNDAIDNDVATAYPFRRFKIKTVRTAKRSLSVEQIRELFSAQVDETEEQYLDMFKLIFFLIGINMADLVKLKEVTEEGRIEFNRAKTKRYYSIKVEPEALAIINKYRGQGHLLSVLDRYKNHEDFRNRTNKALQRLGGTTQGKQGAKVYRPLFPSLTTYWARHTWATIAASLDIPKETIAQALGHGGNTVTDIYIDFDRRKIDEANRRVIDHVLGLV